MKMVKDAGLKARWAFVVAFLAFLLVGVLAETTDVLDTQIPQVANETKAYIERFLKNEHIQPEEITTVQQVDLQNPPEEVKLKNVDDASVAIYQVNYTQGNDDKKIYVVSYATTQFVNPVDIQGTPSIVYFHFGENALSNGTVYLKTAGGARSSDEQGYVMLDRGSITGISTSIRIAAESENGIVRVSVFKNGENIGLENVIDASKTNVKKDYDLQSPEIITFAPGDVLSVQVEASEGVQFDDVIMMVKAELR